MANLEPGSVLHETYELVAPLGRGGMGVVWRARHVRLPKETAIKVLNEAAYESEELLHRFRREAEITSQLGHPHIVEVFDFNVLDDGRAYLVMELLDGESLRERMRRGPMPPKEALEVLRQVGSALARAHEAGIIHRDLKPENVFLCASEPGRPRAKVLDFGISKIQGSQTVVTQESSLLGTPKYMSPEQAKGQNADLDPRTDQFSLGAIAYEMITGQPAFAGDSITAVLYKVLHEEPTPPPEDSGPVPPRVDSAIRRALAKDRDARFPSVEAFVDAITTEPDRISPFSGPAAPAAPAQPAADTAPAPLEPTFVPGAPPRRSFAVPALVVVGLLAGLGGWWAVRGRGLGVVTRPAPALVVAERPDAQAPPAVEDAGPPDVAEVFADAGPPARRPTRRPARARPKLGPRLKEAVAALEAGRFDDARRLAERAFAEGEGTYAHAIRTVAACGQKDIARANAAWRQVRRRDRPRVRNQCRKLGFTMSFAAD